MYRASWALVVAIIVLSGCQQETSSQRNATATTAPSTRPSQEAVVMPGAVFKKDIAYVADGASNQTLDLYAPSNAKSAPVVLFIHGGEWAKGDKAEVSYKPRFLNENGVILISANYRLSGTDRHPAQVRDIAAAVKWVKQNIAQFGGDPNRVFLMGHSAGCHLVTLTALDPRHLGTAGLKPSDLAGVISWSGGAFDLVEKVSQQGMYAEYIQKNFGTDRVVWRDASPVAHAADFKPLPRFLFVSAGEGKAESRIAAENLARLINQAGGEAQSVVLAGKTHFTSNHEVGVRGDSTGQVLIGFIKGTKDASTEAIESPKR